MRLILFMLALGLFATNLMAQNIPGKLVSWNETGDTLTNSDTLTWELSINGTVAKTKKWEYSLIIEADSISGSTAGTIRVQYSNAAPGDADPIWYTANTATIDGVNTIASFEGILYATRIRIYTTSSGSQSTAIRQQGWLRQRD